MLTNDLERAQRSVTMLLTVSAEASASLRRAAGERERLAAPTGRPLTDLERALLNLSIEPLYRASEDGDGDNAQVSRRFLASLMGRPAHHPFELRDLRGLDARLKQHAASVLRLGRGIDGAAYIRRCDKETTERPMSTLQRERT